jgi:hypothetical protein
VTAVGPEYGRLDRILAAQAAKPAKADRDGRTPHLVLRFTHPLTETEQAAVTAAMWSEASAAEVVRLRAMVAALEAECAALTDALAAVTHDFKPMSAYPRRCNWSFCRAPQDALVHRTPVVVRAELEGQ